MGADDGLWGVAEYFRSVPCYKKEDGSIYGPIGKMKEVPIEQMGKSNQLLNAAKTEFEDSVHQELCKIISFKFVVKTEAYPTKTELKEEDYVIT